jgi:hypothetical protein
MRRAAGILPSLAGVPPAGYWAGTRRLVPHDRPKASRLLAGAAALLLVCTAGACGASGAGTPSAPGGGTPTAPGVISIPTGDLSPYYQCMVDAGWKITAVHSTAPGEPPQYDMTRQATSTNPKDEMALWEQCEALRPSPRMLTDDEKRQIYTRWVGEYQCLVGLGYQPDPPPSVETFLATWNTGPWDPTFGVDVDHWTQAQYDEAKAKCTLEFFTNDTYGQ